jgi:D-sedoheptulose 7-phosphate isomerase
MKDVILEQIDDSINTKKELRKIAPIIEKTTNILIKTINSGYKIILFGNGGSAADAQHIAAELVGQYGHDIKRKSLPAMTFTTNTSIITAIGNDIAFENIFSRQVEAFVKKGDAIIGISTSGNSKNVIGAIKLAKSLGAFTIAFTGKKTSKLSDICDITLHVPSTSTQRIQECHILIGHILCGLIEDNLSKKFLKNHKS